MPASQGALRAYVFTEPWFSLTDKICDDHRQQDHEKSQDDVFCFSQPFVAGDFFDFLHKRYFVKQVLDQTEGTQPSWAWSLQKKAPTIMRNPKT